MKMSEQKKGMTPKSQSESRALVYQGVKITADAVASTMGPSGNPVIVWNKGEQDRYPIVTKDGVSVAGLINITDPLMSIGSDLVKMAAARSVSLAGDGTTTASILVRAIYEVGMKLSDDRYVKAGEAEQLSRDLYWHIPNDKLNTFGVNRVEVKRGMDAAVRKVEEFIDSMAIDCDTREDVYRIAHISTNSDTELANVITDAVMKTGDDGLVTYEKTQDRVTSLDFVNGYKHDSPMLHERFANTPKNECVFEDALVLICHDVIEDADHIIPYMDAAYQVYQKPLVVVAKEIIGSARSVLEQNAEKGLFLAVQASGYGDNMKNQLEDLAAYTNAKVIGEEYGLLLADTTKQYVEHLKREITIPLHLECLGEVSKVISHHRNSDKGYTLFQNEGLTEEVSSRVSILKTQLESVKEDMQAKAIQARIARLTSKVALIKVGGESVIEIDERFDRVDDAVKAVKAAKQEGVVSGGGSIFLHAQKALTDYVLKHKEDISSDKMVGYNLIGLVLDSPFRQIFENSTGLFDGSYRKIAKEIVSKGNNYGYNAKTNKVENLIESGVIDPAKVSKVALNSASSTASTALSAETFIIPENN